MLQYHKQISHLILEFDLSFFSYCSQYSRSRFFALMKTKCYNASLGLTFFLLYNNNNKIHKMKQHQCKLCCTLLWLHMLLQCEWSTTLPKKLTQKSLKVSLLCLFCFIMQYPELSHGVGGLEYICATISSGMSHEATKRGWLP